MIGNIVFFKMLNISDRNRHHKVISTQKIKYQFLEFWQFLTINRQKSGENSSKNRELGISGRELRDCGRKK